MKLQDVAALLHQMRGALGTVVMAMMFINKPVTRVELVSLTGYSDPTMRNALSQLGALGMVKRNNRGNAWVLTERARTLHVSLSEALDETRETSHGENISPARSSSSLSEENDVILDEILNPRTTREKKDYYQDAPPLADAALAAVRILCKAGVARHTTNAKGAEDCVRAALDGDWTADRILKQVRAWMAYAKTEQGGSVRQPAFLAAARIRELQDAPSLPSKDDGPPDGRKYIGGKYADLIKH